MSKAYVLPGLGTGSIKSLQVYRAGALTGPLFGFQAIELSTAIVSRWSAPVLLRP